MKALTLTQPWATLVAIGAKRSETRSWQTPYRGPLAIHAALRMGREPMRLLFQEPFRQVLAAAGYRPSAQMPLGVIVATCTLVTCCRPEILTLTDQERAFGDYSFGRWAWILDDITPLVTPVAAKGMLGLWEWNP
jgi:activating signal cointegrator 1